MAAKAVAEKWNDTKLCRIVQHTSAKLRKNWTVLRSMQPVTQPNAIPNEKQGDSPTNFNT